MEEQRDWGWSYDLSPYLEAARWFQENLKAARERRGISQTQLANTMAQRGFQWYQTTVSRTEAGERPVQLGEAMALADILNQSVDELMRPPDRHSVLTRLREIRQRLKAAKALLSDLVEFMCLGGFELARHYHYANSLGLDVGDLEDVEEEFLNLDDEVRAAQERAIRNASPDTSPAASSERFDVLAEHLFLAGSFASKDAARQEAIRRRLENLTKDGPRSTFELFSDRTGHYRWRLKASNGEIIAISEDYTSRSGALNSVDSVRRSAPDAQLDDQTD